MEETIASASGSTLLTLPPFISDFDKHPILYTLFIIGLLVFVREFVVWMLGTGRIADALKEIRDELKRLKK